MPIYEYRCRGCGVVAEILHGMSEVPQLHCTCGSDDIVRKISLCSVISHQTLDSARKQETSKRHDDMKADLWENYGVSGVKPLPNIERKGYDQIYQDVKTGGGQIKEKMQATREVNLAKMEKKNKARKENFDRNLKGKRIEQIKERQLKKKSEQRAIAVQS